MIVLFTDFGADDNFVGQVKAALLGHLPAAPQRAEFPRTSGRPSTGRIAERVSSGHCFLVRGRSGRRHRSRCRDPSSEQQMVCGPDNGLLSVVAARATKTQTRRIVWRPSNLSSSFHRRDLFAPVAARIARGDLPIDAIEETGELQVRLGLDDPSEVIYTDHYGNALTGLRAHNVPLSAAIAVRDH